LRENNVEVELVLLMQRILVLLGNAFHPITQERGKLACESSYSESIARRQRGGGGDNLVWWWLPGINFQTIRRGENSR